MSHKIKIVIILISSISSLILVFFIWYLASAHTKLMLQDDTFELHVKSGDTLVSLLQNLDDQDIISNTTWFRFYTKLHPQKSNIQAGFFTLKKGTTYLQLLEILQNAKPQVISVTFLEGWRVNQYIQKLAHSGFDKKLLEKCLQTCTFDYHFITDEVQEYQYEGYLYPDTYYFHKEAQPFDIFNRLLGNFDKKTRDLSFDQQNIFEVITIASMIEKEEKKTKEKYIISGVMHNRIRDGVTLGIDATVLYALGDWKAELNYTTLAIDSPYNTRKYAGLPPSPIANPSVESIKAALSPKQTDYYYYLHDKEGNTHFSTTLTGHNSKKAQYLQ